MEKDFFETYNNQRGLSLELGHNSVADWAIIIRDKKGVSLGNEGVIICQVQSCDRYLVFAKAYCELVNYLSDTRGGY